ncbi:MAG TPA: sulfotransferase [Acidimicrobiia bacterium]|nr:sulfotransferase [Acidimicrobiia bacterium]
MTLRVVGAGLGRTGTHSLKLALEQLLGAPCYHMLEVFSHPEHIPVWQAAVDGEPVDWNAVMDGYVAAVDWPAAAFWRELADANPGAIVLLSTRSGADAWWKSAHDTIFEISQREAPPDAVITAQMTMAKTMLARRFTPGWTDEAAAMRAYEEHNAAVRASVPASRLVDWQPGDGWEPICAALGVAVPDTPFPHVNTTDEFRAMLGLNE